MSLYVADIPSHYIFNIQVECIHIIHFPLKSIMPSRKKKTKQITVMSHFIKDTKKELKKLARISADHQPQSSGP